MAQSVQLVIFTLDGQRYALHLSAVERVVRVVEVASLPNAPASVLGVINFQGWVIPVFNLRQRFHLPEREMDLNDRLIIAHTAKRRVALLAEGVLGVSEAQAQQLVAREQILPDLDYVKGIAKLEGNLILIHDLDTFLSLDEEQALTQALQTATE